MTGELSVLVVEDEPLSLDELVHLLRGVPGVGQVASAPDAMSALKLLRDREFDAAFLDIGMPGLDGMELAAVLSRLARPPAVVFVTASQAHAIDAFGIGAVDYLLKPASAGRVRQALERVGRARAASAAPGTPAASATPGIPAGAPPEPAGDLAVLKVESAGRTRFVRREQVRFVEAHGDHVRLDTRDGRFLVRMPLSALEHSWSQAGFLRVHRSFLLALRAVEDLRTDVVGQLVAHTAGGDVPVSRRHARHLKEQLFAAAREGRVGGARR
ncbi:DNA-binding response regulator [Streptomyces filipinensis]|uniref:DNA-binding response regulator n=1 Tax=Streptomyces filipinensis TaxID=66887 RepID=A0A918IA21_9ACTN|nr:LytTR family DNA-binding domain-containing protein [Streptomyces filipinensis]GGU93272.1 DNA-binding response regulator [Streptomyces filipinensis]